MIPDSEIAVFARRLLDLAPDERLELRPLSKRGSERSFFHAEMAKGRAIIVNYSTAREENAYFADIGRFLDGIGVAVPRILAEDSDRQIIIMQDLGESDLWSSRGSHWEVRRRLYSDALEGIRRLHACPVSAARVKMMPAFGPSLYRWEREYFRENFVGRYCALEPWPDAGGLETELEGLAGRLSLHPSCLVHRDLQSQNIMVESGRTYFIDFQGMRPGTFFYDLGSLLYDPYVSIEEGERLELLKFYYTLNPSGFSADGFDSAFREAAAQRLMQSLGAYGFLGLGKGLASFLAHIPAALDNLIDAADKSGKLPKLLKLAHACKERIGQGT